MTTQAEEAPKPRRGRPPKPRAEEAPPPPATERAFELFQPPPKADPNEAPTGGRGPVTPAQWDDDGWGGLPVQMRG